MKRISLLLLSLISLTACSIFQKKVDSTTLYAYNWELMYITGIEMETLPEPATISFKDNGMRTGGSYNGFGGCNGYSGTYTMQKGHINFDGAISTKKGCKVGMQTEQALHAQIMKVKQYDIQDGHLNLRDAAGNVLMKFVKGAPIEVK